MTKISQRHGAPRETRKPSSSEGGCAAVRQRHVLAPVGKPPRKAVSLPCPVWASASTDTKRALPDTNKHEIPTHCLRRHKTPFREGRNAAVFVMPRGISCPAWRKARSAEHGFDGGRGTRSPDRRQGMSSVRRRRSFDMVGFRVPPVGQIM